MLSQSKSGSTGVVTNISTAVRSKYYPSLNGLRGISIILVVLSHLQLSNSNWYPILFDGGLGVNIFFVLSGFLITTLCLKEKELTGNLALKDFYIRRMLRIFPVAYLYLVVLVILNYVFHLQIAYFQFLGAGLYLMNFSYFPTHRYSMFVSHFWSLAVEEQFYIVFPFILKKNIKLFKWAILFIIAVLPILFTIQDVYFPENHLFHEFVHFFIKFQSIAIGCLLSLFAFNKVFDKKWILSYKVAGNIIAFILIIYLNYVPFSDIKSVYYNLIISVLTAYIIITNIIPSDRDFVYKFLNSKILSFIGILSYSIYIWQQIFTSNNSKNTGVHLPDFLILFPCNLIFIIIVPLLSYFFYEKYFLKLKEKFVHLNKKNKQYTT